MAGVSGRMVFFAFSLLALGCTLHKHDKNISSKPPIIETAVGDSMQKYDTTKKMDLSVVPKKDTLDLKKSEYDSLFNKYNLDDINMTGPGVELGPRIKKE
jgi:hypothetical protein